MTDIVRYRVVLKNPDTGKGIVEADAYHAKWRARETQACKYMKRLAEDYDAAATDENAKSHLVLRKAYEPYFTRVAATVDVTSTKAFKEHLESQRQNLITHVESPSAAQFFVTLPFVPATPVLMLADPTRLGLQFDKAAAWFVSGQPLTQGEHDARVKENDAVFGKLTECASLLKQQHPEYLLEVQEKTLGTFFVRVTSKENNEGDVAYPEIEEALERAVDGHSCKVKKGPDLYPSDIAKLRGTDKNYRESKKLQL